MAIGSSTDSGSAAVRARVAGRAVSLEPRQVRAALARVEPRRIQDHFVVVNRRRYPVKQALAAATGLDPADFTSQHARSVLRRLGLPLGRLSQRPAGPSSADVGPAGIDRREGAHDRAERLRPYLNRWVAVQRDRVLTDGDSFGDVLSWLQAREIRADAVFLVPEDPDRLSMGLTS